MSLAPVTVALRVVNRFGEAAGRKPYRTRATFGSTWAPDRSTSTPTGWGACHGLPLRRP